MTPKQCGRMINSNMEYLKREGLHIKKYENLIKDYTNLIMKNLLKKMNNFL